MLSNKKLYRSCVSGGLCRLCGLYGALLLVLLTMASCVPPPYIPPTNQQPNLYGGYSNQAVNYLTEVGLGSEFGNSPQVINKWNSPIRIQLHGSYQATDEQELDSIISELTKLTGLSITRRAGNQANINIHFIPEENFHHVISGYRLDSDQMGVFQTFFNANDNIIYKAVIAVEHTLQGNLRRHILREEVTQSLGLMKDSYRYTNSIFQQSTDSEPTQYAQIDREVIRILYDQRIKPGMRRQDILQALSSNQGETTTIAFNPQSGLLSH